jgi:hypothetical protein
MCAELDCTPQTLENWAAANPEFLESMTIAITKSQQWWEDAGQQGMYLDKFGSPVWQKNMACRFRDWREKTEQTQLGPDGGAVKHEHVHKIERVFIDINAPNNTD